MVFALTATLPAGAQPGLIGYWKFNGDAMDSSGSGNHGIEVGGPGYAPGIQGLAIQLDGMDDYVKVLSSPSLESWHTTNALTIEAWVFPASLRRMFIFGKQGGNCLDEFSVEMQVINGQGTIVAQVVDDCQSPKRIYSNTKLVPGRWYHIAYVWQGSTASLYVDGVFDSSVSGIGNEFFFGEELHIGHVRGDPQNTVIFHGLIDEARMWDVARTQAEIVDNMFCELPCNCNRPPVIWAATPSPAVLWPPNHKMVRVTVGVSVTDNCNDNVTCKIVAVASNEPVSGTGDDDQSPDWIITGDLTVDLRAERADNGTGRVYTLTVECTDGAGNKSRKTATVSVPRSNPTS